PAVAVPPQPHAATGHAVTVATGTVAGAGGAVGQPIALPAFSAADPLRVSVLGDSVAAHAEPGIAAALDATGAVTVSNSAFTGFGLNRFYTNGTHRAVTGFWWMRQMVGPTHPDLVLATWNWDGSCTPTVSTPTKPTGGYDTYRCAVQHPKQYQAKLEKAVRYLITTAGAKGVVFLEFPVRGPNTATGQVAGSSTLAAENRGIQRWNAIARSMPARFPGKVMYLPVASSVLLDGKFEFWLPTPEDPNAPRSQWLRARMVDGLHLCPAGIARYADAILADLSRAYPSLPPASPGWATGTWVNDSFYHLTQFTGSDPCPAGPP
ncbi:MAG TPA: SGNH/GDSL hydrolase family protein, partial [Acidimicrobiales bacterium]|nr:SGNH/GDSL hydrolase family protein [Acidimicrobiales bacterium]